MTDKKVIFVVVPCEQWHKEYPGRPKYIFWTHKQFALESADDTGGTIIELKEGQGFE